MTQDPSLHDQQLENEIKLVGELVLAASQSDDAMSQDEIDDVLGLERDEDDLPVESATEAAAADVARDEG